MVDFFSLKEKYDSKNMYSEILNQGKSALFSVQESFYEIKEPKKFKNVIITGAGDKYLIGLLGKFLWDSISDIPINVYHSRTLHETKPKTLNKDSLCIFLSQSGKTEDTLKALELAKKRKCQLLGITNNDEGFKGVKNNLITKVAEESLPSTGTFHATTAMLYYYILTLFEQKKLLNTYFETLKKVDKDSTSSKIIKWSEKKAEEYKEYEHFYVLGDGPRYPIARKSALIMLMEAAKVNAHPMMTEEFIHSLIETLEKEQNTPLILLKPKQSFVSPELYKTIQSIEKMWKDKIVIKSNAEHNILSAQLYAIPLEWFAYNLALMRKVDPGIGRLVNKVRG